MAMMLLFGAGLVLLVAGAEALVRGAAGLAGAFRVPHVVVGLLVVGYGTSTPELGVSLGAALSGQTDVALGNVVGSNIFNVVFILGLSALIAPLIVGSRLVRLDVPLMCGLSALFLLMALDGHVGRIDGAILLAGLVAYTLFTLRLGRQEAGAQVVEGGDGVEPQPGRGLLPSLLFAVGGLVGLVFGAQWFVEGAVSLAEDLGVSPLIVGLLVVAAGTSLPEVVTSVVATIRGDRDIAVGNVVGSNIFNMLGVQGVASAAAEVAVAPSMLRFDMPVMVAVALACLPIFFTRHRIDRWEGGLFLAIFAAYGAYLFLAALRPEYVPGYTAAMALIVAPLLAITLAVVAVQEHRKNRSR